MKFHFSCLFVLSAFSAYAQDPGDDFFAQWKVHDIRFEFHQTGFWDSLKQNYTLDVYMQADVMIDGKSYHNSGVKFKGNSSYNNASNKKPFRIDLAEYVDGQSHDDLKKIVLNNGFKDPSFLREKMMLDFLYDHGIAGPRCGFARLYINGEYRGLYTVVEDVNKTFLEDRYGNKDGNLFKGDPRGTLVYKGSSPSLYSSDYELKTNEKENDWSDLIRFVDALNRIPSAQLKDSLATYMNTDSWLDYWAAHNIFVNLDSYIGSGHNYFIYHNTDSDQFDWISWDVNEAFGNFQMGQSLTNLKNLAIGYIPTPTTQRPVMNRLWGESYWKQALVDRICALLPDFSNEKLNARIDSLANLIRQDVYADTYKTYSNAQFEQNLSQDLNITVPGSPAGGMVAGIKSFINDRRTSLTGQLKAFGCVSTDQEAVSGTGVQKLYPSLLRSGCLYITGIDIDKDIRIEIFNATGAAIHAVLVQKTTDLISLSIDPQVPPGYYVVKCIGGKGSKSFSFVKE